MFVRVLKHIKASEIQYLVDAHHKVININYIRNCLKDYEDKKICVFLEYGFPIGYGGMRLYLSSWIIKRFGNKKNHKGAHEHPEEMDTYLQKEMLNKAKIGPF